MNNQDDDKINFEIKFSSVSMFNHFLKKNILEMKYYLKYLLFILCLLTSLTACNNDAEYSVVDFNDILKEKQVKEASLDSNTLKVAVAAMVSPKETLTSYQALLNYIGQKLDMNIELIQRESYAEINEMISTRQLDIAFICTGPYASGREKYGFEALVTPVINGKPLYQAYLIVHKDAPFQTLEDLKGRSFAFTDPDSNTGTFIPQYWLSRIGETDDSFFSDITYTHSHDNSILAVAKQLVDGASVNSLIWDYYQSRNPVYTSKTRIIKKSELLGGPPLVASKFLSKSLKSKIRQLLSEMHKDIKGKKILNNLKIDSFRPSEESWYESVRLMNQDFIQEKTKGHEVK